MKHFSGFLALFFFASLPLYAAGLDDLTWTTTDGEVTITDCDEAATGGLVIPDTIEGNPVTSIGRAAFGACESLTNITIPDGVTSIGDGAFQGCNRLTSITIPDSVTSIAYGAFTDCTRLTSITIPDSVPSIGDFAFLGCRSLTSITIPDSVTSIGDYAFYDCTILTSITFQGSAPDVGDGAFLNVAGGAIATVTAANLSSFGSDGESWNGLILSTADQSDAIADLEAQLAEAIAQRDAAIAEREARPTAEALVAVTAERDAAIAERDARPTSAQLTAAIAERDAAIAERDARPTADQLAAVEAERDARPTAEALVTVEEERDAIMTDIQLAYDEVNAATGGAAEEDLVAVAPTSSATIFDLVWTNSGDPADTIEMTIEFPEGTVANPVEVGFGTVRPTIGTILTIDYQGTVTVINSPRMAFNSPVELDFSQELMGQNGFGATVGQAGSGDFNLFGAEVPEGTFNGQNYFTLGAPDGSLYTLTSMLAPATSRFSSLELNPLTELYASLVATNEDAIAERDAAIAERDSRPTTEELATVEAERDARFTEDQIRALSADYTIGLNEAGNVQMKFNLFESADLNTFAPLTLNPDSVSVVDGSICLEFAPEDSAAFFRFSVE